MPQYYIMTLQYMFENIPPPQAYVYPLRVQALPFHNFWPYISTLFYLLEIKFKTCGKSVLHTKYIFCLWYWMVITAIWLRTEVLWVVTSCQMVKAPTFTRISLLWLLEPEGKALWSFKMSVNVFISQYSITTNMTTIFSASFFSATIVPICSVFLGFSHC